ncbi:MAG: LysR family transcriptional regulator [Lachnospiraceae bacterium]
MVNNLEYYKTFYYVALHGSITIAAEKLMISQPAVSQSMKQLEQQLGTKLVVRNAKGVKLTTEGELLYSYVSKGYQQILLGEKKLEQLLNVELGEIKIGASDMTLKYYLLPYLETFHEKYPKIKVSVTNAPTPETVQLLKDGMIDFGVVSSPIEKTEQMDVIPVKEIEDVFVAGRRFTSYKNKMMDFSDLKELPLILLEKNTSTRRYIDQFLEEKNIQVEPEFELANSDMIVQFSLRNLGVGYVVKDFAEEYIEAGTLFTFRFNEILPKRTCCIIKGKKNRLSIAAINLLKMLEQ